MIVVSYGIQKSGSTLAFEMARAVLELNGYAQPRLAEGIVNARPPGINMVGPWTDERLSRLVEATEGWKIVVKTHGSPQALSTSRVLDLVGSGDLKIHVVFRDPRDTVLSLLDAGVRARARKQAYFSEIRTFDGTIAMLGARLQALRQWGSFPSLKLEYDDFAFDRVRGPQLIADDLGVHADPDEVWKIVDGRFTQRNVARPQRYKTELWPAEVARVEKAFPLYLELVRGNCARRLVPGASVIVVSYGVEKSGSTLAFEMAKAVLELNGYAQPRLTDGVVNAGPRHQRGRSLERRAAGSARRAHDGHDDRRQDASSSDASVVRPGPRLRACRRREDPRRVPRPPGHRGLDARRRGHGPHAAREAAQRHTHRR